MNKIGVVANIFNIYIFILQNLNIQNKLLLGTAVSAFNTRPQPRIHSIKSKLYIQQQNYAKLVIT